MLQYRDMEFRFNSGKTGEEKPSARTLRGWRFDGRRFTVSAPKRRRTLALPAPTCEVA